MVLRKPVPSPEPQATTIPPYPTTPTSEIPPPVPGGEVRRDGEVYSPDLHTSPAFNLSTLDTARRLREKTGSEDGESSIHTDSEWDTDGFEDLEDEIPKSERKAVDTPAPLKVGVKDEAPNPERKQDIPASLKVGGAPGAASKEHSEGGIPAPLRVGPPDGVIRRSPSPQTQFAPASVGSGGSGSSIPLQSHNPYLKLQHTGQQPLYGTENSSAIWGDGRSQTNPFVSNTPPVELPADRSPVEQFSKLSLNTTGNSQAANPASPSSKQPPLIPVSPEGEPPRLTRHDSDLASSFNPGMDVSSLDAFSSRNHGLPQTHPENDVHRSWEDQQAWERSERERKDRELAAAHEAAQRAEAERKAEEEWHQGEAAAAAALQQPVREDAPAPPLPPRSYTEENPPPKPPRPQVDTSRGSSTQPGEVETPATRANRQRKEHYQIKQIRWQDTATGKIRQSPIIVQNANGPCPLLALVNALVLSTAADEETALVETLRTREQVTLGLLLDAVFDELMSGRRGGAAQELPDVGELYSFLITLHTGMNVNPSFVNSLDDPGNGNLGQFHPAVRGQAQPGGFENTREMKLYSTFNIPLIHGWLPPGESRAYAAFERVAKTYEDAHVVQFQEEELEAKLQSEGLNAEEQKLFEDLHAIKEFLERWPTQLTPFGLEVITNSLSPGQIAILFRNDHFSTLYKEPRTGQLMTLVTDAGYSRHEEIVWETLVDVNGQGSELYSGDFRPVGNMSEAAAGGSRPGVNERPIRSLLDDDDDQGWTTVEGRNRRNNQSSGRTSDSQPTGPVLMSDPTAGPSNDISRIEQEDHDLALALQLQEEEEDRHRREVADRRRRETELNEEYLSNEQNRTGPNSNANRNQNRPLIPPRRNHGTGSSTAPATHRPATDDEAPPPTYEQAASGRPYHPPPGHPANPSAPLGGGRGARPAQQNQSAYGQMNSGQANTMPGPGPHGRRRNGRQSLGGQVPLVDQIPSGSGRGGRRHSATVGPNEQDKEKCAIM